MDRNNTWSNEFFQSRHHGPDAKPPEYASYHFCNFTSDSFTICCFVGLPVFMDRSEGLLLVIPDAFLPQGRALDMSRFNVSFVFAQAASFVRQARAIRVQLDSADWGGPGVKLNFDEVGLIGGSGCPVHDSVRGAARLFVDERLFFNLGAAMFAYTYGELAAVGADMIAASQTLAFNGTALHPTPFYPCLTLIDWVPPYGGNARFWGLKLMIDVLGSELKTVVAVNATTGSAPPPVWWPTPTVVYAAGFIKLDGKRVVLLANTNSSTQTVAVEGASGAVIHVVDSEHGYGDRPYSNDTLESETIQLRP